MSDNIEVSHCNCVICYERGHEKERIRVLEEGNQAWHEVVNKRTLRCIDLEEENRALLDRAEKAEQQLEVHSLAVATAREVIAGKDAEIVKFFELLCEAKIYTAGQARGGDLRKRISEALAEYTATRNREQAERD